MPLRRSLLVLPLATAVGLALAFGLDAYAERSFQAELLDRAREAARGSQAALNGILRERRAPAANELLAQLVQAHGLAGAALCGRHRELVARAPTQDDRVGCDQLGPLGGRAASDGSRYLFTLPIEDGADLPGSLVLAWDRRAPELRASAFRTSVWVSFSLTFALAAWAFTWSRRRALRQSSKPNDMSQVPLPPPRRAGFFSRFLGWRAARRHRHSKNLGAWSPELLRKTLKERLAGERIIVVSNREPYVHERGPSGEIKVVHPASGLVTALEPVLRACSGIWIAHGSGSADRETVDKHDRVRVPPGEEAYAIRRIWLNEEEERGYYQGFSNEALWPLCHQADTRPVFRAEDWRQYVAVNKKFALAVLDEVRGPDPIVLVQDYHLALLPKLIREALPDAVILTFWHIPWPNRERFGICPWREQILEGLLGSTIAGFHTPAHCNNFIETADQFLEVRVDRDARALVKRGRSTHVRAYPISIAWPDRWADTAPPISECKKGVFEELKLGAGALLGVGVDRIDYTKGIEERLLAVEHLLEIQPALVGRFTFVQLGAPSRSTIDAYRSLGERIEALVERINCRFGNDTYRPIAMLRKNHGPADVYRYYRAADLCYVSSLHDGMNLVAKEFVSARADEAGVLVLSAFAGAARELTQALIVNPYDIGEAARALAAALAMPQSEQRARMRAMRSLISELNVYRWAGDMLEDAAIFRYGDRLRRDLGEWTAHTQGQ